MGFITTDSGAWDDIYVLGLTLKEHHLWNFLNTGSKYGVIEVNPFLWETKTKLTMDEIKVILAKFKKDKKVKLYKDVVWSIKGMYYRRLRGENLKQAIIAIDERYSNEHPDLIRDVRAQYQPQASVPKTTKPSSEVEQITEYLRSIKGWKSLPNDTSWVTDLVAEFSTLEVMSVAKTLSAWLADRPKDGASKNRLRTFCVNSKRFGQNLREVSPTSQRPKLERG